jgi:hypothetical protein
VATAALKIRGPVTPLCDDVGELGEVFLLDGSALVRVDNGEDPLEPALLQVYLYRRHRLSSLLLPPVA